MKLPAKLLALTIVLMPVLPLTAHPVDDQGVLRLTENRRPQERQLLQVPDVGGYITLKCDFHMHTVFSDGLVWPTIRIQEAWQEGLDAICITDHLEYQPHKADVPTNHNRSNELAVWGADLANLILIKGSELTRNTPPGHFNALFIGDASELVVEKGSWELDQLAIDKAAGQNAFIFWNHPGWKVGSVEGSYEWIPFLDQLKSENKVHGIEVINSFNFYRKALDWALDNNLTVMGTSDIHNLTANEYDMERGVRRTMTLVFARERSVEGIREALDAGRTVAWATKVLAGREEWVRALYDASVSVGAVHYTDRRGHAYAEITNASDFYFELQRVGSEPAGWPETIALNPGTTRVLDFGKDPEIATASYTVTNAFVGSDRCLVVDIRLDR